MQPDHVLAVVQSDLQFICALRTELDAHGFQSTSIARNGQEALLYLRGVGIYRDRSKYPVPSAIILDTQSPEGADLEVLSWCRERSEYCDLPVVLLCLERHRERHISCALDRACFLVNRGNFDELAAALRHLRPQPVR